MHDEKQDFENALRTKERAFVLFYASWCPHSQSFLPIFRKYSKANPDECLSVVIDDKPDLCDKYSIDYYPTVILFKKGKIHKRLDPPPGGDLTEKQLQQLSKEQ